MSDKDWIGCDIEDQYFGHDRKSSKAERKMASAKDRSKYKKTDMQKEVKKTKVSLEGLTQGRVISVESQGITVALDDGTTFNCTLRGLFKKESSQMKNLVAVGDLVWIDKINDKEGLITHVEDRKSVLSRADTLSRRKEQIIASNIDQVLITASVVSPPIKFPLIDRYIIAAHKGGMAPVVIINKIDMLKKTGDPIVDQDKAIYEELVKAYQKAGIPLIGTSIETGEGIDQAEKYYERQSIRFLGSVWGG